MTDAEWAVVRDALPVPACLEGRGGQPEGYCHRQMIDAVFYVTDNGVKWLFAGTNSSQAASSFADTP